MVKRKFHRRKAINVIDLNENYKIIMFEKSRKSQIESE